MGIPPAYYKADDKGENVLCEAGYIKIRNRFSNYWGEYVLHCHILVHEDLGMMQNVYVANDPERPGCDPCQQVEHSTPSDKGGIICGNCYPPSYPSGFTPDIQNGKGKFSPQRQKNCIDV